MLLGVIINFSLMFTFIVFSYFVLEYFREKQPFFIDLQPFIVSIISTIISLLLMKTAYPFDHGFIGDLRNVSILISGLIGGPIALLLTSILVGFFRMFFFEIGPTSFVSGATIIILGFIIFFVALKKQITYKNVHYYLIFQTVITCSIVFFLESRITRIFEMITFAVITNVIGFYVTIFVLKLFYKQFERIRMIEKLAETDYITDLPNNRKFKEVFQETLKEEQPFTFLLIDIDDFKLLNKKHGHASGDEMLYQLACRLKTFAQEHDGFAARVGGEEFYILFYEAAPATAIQYATEIMIQVRDEPFKLLNGSSANLTVSIGLASFPDNGETIPELVDAIDHATMTASSRGKNNILHANLLK
ncbi:Stalked cell differentiation-controlling protein [Kurthia zopfii]|nr:Stalked cell differentiation-controlling protein [Kurthia zopfii]